MDLSIEANIIPIREATKEDISREKNTQLTVLNSELLQSSEGNTTLQGL
jgi:hypothetical protein